MRHRIYTRHSALVLIDIAQYNRNSTHGSDMSLSVSLMIRFGSAAILARSRAVIDQARQIL